MKFILNLVCFSVKLCQITLRDLGLLGGFTLSIIQNHLLLGMYFIIIK
jgi:hypothetical protein